MYFLQWGSITGFVARQQLIYMSSACAGDAAPPPFSASGYLQGEVNGALSLPAQIQS